MNLSNLADGELKEISMRKKKNGCATKEALKAQEILFNREHPFGINQGYRDTSNIAFGTNETEW